VFAECRSLTAEGKKLLMQYGSSQINNLRFRDNFIMIGQKGLAEGSAVEQVFTCLLSSSGTCNHVHFDLLLFTLNVLVLKLYMLELCGHYGVEICSLW